jgi:hypothetical protein
MAGRPRRGLFQRPYNVFSLSLGVQGYCSDLSDKTYVYPLSGFIIELLHKRSKPIVAQRSWVPLGELFARPGNPPSLASFAK